ncbi:EamA family transporter [Xenophilus arseniciresistens]|uniref:EamA family transporter n=1 Tax=Xenophilus arseniciresistens TaxID=1283306 RepID=UPI002FE05C2E
MSALDLTCALSAVVLWGLNFVAMKYGMRDFTAFQLGALRYIAAVIPLIFFVRRPSVSGSRVLLFGLAQLGQFGFLFVALQMGMTSALASVLMQVQVFFTVILGVVVLKENVSRPMQVALVLAALGLACFAMNVGGAVAGGIALGSLLLNLLGALMWASSNIIARQTQAAHPGYDPLQFVVWTCLVPILPFLLLSWLFDPVESRQNWTNAGAGAWMAVLYLGWFVNIGAFTLWTRLLQRHPANRVAPFSLGIPLIGMAAGIALLDEQVTPWQWAGCACVLLALCVVVCYPQWRRWVARPNAA